MCDPGVTSNPCVTSSRSACYTNVSPGTGHQLPVPTGKADPAPPRVMSADLIEVNGALTPADWFAGEASRPEVDWGLLDVGLSPSLCGSQSA